MTNPKPRTFDFETPEALLGQYLSLCTSDSDSFNLKIDELKTSIESEGANKSLRIDVCLTGRLNSQVSEQDFEQAIQRLSKLGFKHEVIKGDPDTIEKRTIVLFVPISRNKDYKQIRAGIETRVIDHIKESAASAMEEVKAIVRDRKTKALGMLTDLESNYGAGFVDRNKIEAAVAAAYAPLDKAVNAKPTPPPAPPARPIEYQGKGILTLDAPGRETLNGGNTLGG